ncbi:Gfo/Idh/MocA family protein [Neorhodopirellula pilleata]|uniref:1,5-anhydro-D-fructose reductase n=1 Tax=Neorhodopirellula pilleata TaxID=2714738 RepID=A0A5C6AQU7_9BACT|nr:Gfo/Idh/MocA family oxidoreductase [Neorhodopirellula pilleata]TWU01436.1 1,5-anhydro-D-fructose reductase [Neorhodopirellula pilleata]
MISTPNRRNFLAVTAATAASAGFHSGTFAATADAEKARSKVERRGIGSIGMRYQGTVIAEKASAYGDIVAIADVDRHVREQSRAGFGSTPKIYEDYQDLLANPKVDVVTIGSPDHWHVKMAVDACRAGKDVYVEKPISLTIDEGKLIRKVAAETGRIVQVGSWQRSDQRFRLAVEMVRGGRIGDLQRVDIVLGKNPAGGPFEVRRPPSNLNWELWQGPANANPYMEERCHYTFRYWYEYAGGLVTDWGAHHLDIAQWAINADPIKIHSSGTMPSTPNGYNVPIDYQLTYQYPGGIEMTVADEGRNGILFTGSKGRIFVNRGTLEGKPVEDLKSDPLTRENFALYEHDNLNRPEQVGKLNAIINHMGNFFDSVESRKPPVSDVESQHRSATTCHLGNLSLRLGRDLTWDPETESFPDDDEANAMLSRPNRKGYEVI